MINLAGFGNLFVGLYRDVFDVYRYGETLNSDGTHGIELSQTPIHKNIRCRISFSQVDTPTSTREENNPAYMQIKLFCEPAIEIRKGDYIVAKRMNESGQMVAEYKGIANLPFEYVTHKEFAITETGDA